MKGVFVILDGVADEANPALNGKTPLEAANTPNLDNIAKKSKMDYCYPLGEGVTPQSSSAIVSLLGYDHRFSQRGPLEAKGLGIKLAKGDLAFRTNFATIDSIADGNILDRRAGRTLTNKEARILADAINTRVKLPYKFEFYPSSQHRGVLVFRGGFSDNITNIDPAYGSGVAIQGHHWKLKFSKPMDDEEESKFAADLVNNFARQSHDILDKHPLNIKRAKKGLFSANFLLCRDPGNEPAQFKKLKGRWMALSYTALETGIASAAKMDLYKFKYPKMKNMDFYSNIYLGLNKAMKNAIKMIRRNYKKYDYFFIHIKESDAPGHDNKPLEKVKIIEMLDKKLFYFLNWFLEKRGGKLVLTSDHTTSCRIKGHSDKPVPVLSYPNTKISKNQDNHNIRFTESCGMEGRKIPARKLLQQTLFSN